MYRLSVGSFLALSCLAIVLPFRYDVPNSIYENNINARNEDDDIQIVHLSQADHPKYNFDAFGKNIQLHLTPNEKIVSDAFKSYVRDGKNRSEISAEVKRCYYLHKDNFSSAAVQFCNNNEMNGLIFYEKYVLEIAPANTEGPSGNSGVPHIVKRNFIESHPWNFDPEFSKTKESTIEEMSTNEAVDIDKRGFRNTNPVVEAALFFDEAAFKIFAPYFNYDIVQLRDMLLAYMNGVQALYHHPSCGSPVELTLTRLEILQSQPHDLPHHGGEREALLDSFCDYNVKHNPESDEDPEHWDIGLYVSGLDFYAIEKGKKNGVTMGLAVVGGICQVKYACVIAEFGVTNIFGKPYPSAGFTSVFILAHEIGHSLGMHHDGYTNDCPKDGFIMSPSRGVFGETLWSTCSAQVLTGLNTWATCLYDEPVIMNELDHRKFQDTPGVIWNLKRQCELLLKDQDAEPFQNQQEEEICKNIQCKTPHRTGFYFAGPAMEGTLCGAGKWCQGGECVAKPDRRPDKVVDGGWSEWKTEGCESGCILNAKGYFSRQRSCNNPAPINTNRGCNGLSYEVHTCNDYKICRNRRKTVEEYASSKCKEFANYVNEIDRLGSGLQAPHEPDRSWMGCTIFCKRHDGSSFYTPRVELNDFGIDPYFPDGTWCNYDGKYNYYCLQHHCLPENFQFNKNLLWKNDILIPQNAPPNIAPLPENLKKYLSTDLNGNPLLKTLTPESNLQIPEDAWSNKDYIEIF